MKKKISTFLDAHGRIVSGQVDTNKEKRFVVNCDDTVELLHSITKASEYSMTTDEARNFLVAFMNLHFSDTTFNEYIETQLAGDFAWQLANALKKLTDPTPHFMRK